MPCIWLYTRAALHPNRAACLLLRVNILWCNNVFSISFSHFIRFRWWLTDTDCRYEAARGRLAARLAQQRNPFTTLCSDSDYKTATVALKTYFFFHMENWLGIDKESDWWAELVMALVSIKSYKFPSLVVHDTGLIRYWFAPIWLSSGSVWLNLIPHQYDTLYLQYGLILHWWETLQAQ